MAAVATRYALRLRVLINSSRRSQSCTPCGAAEPGAAATVKAHSNGPLVPRCSDICADGVASRNLANPSARRVSSATKETRRETSPAPMASAMVVERMVSATSASIAA